MKKRILRGICLFLVTILVPAPGYAWNGFGHRAVAKIAYLEIDDGQKAAIFALLKNHPHFKVLKDFPKTGTDTSFFSDGRHAGVSEVEWAILQAATWPDFVRVPRFSRLTAKEIQNHPVHKYHHKFDHFADIPLVDPTFKLPIKQDDSGSLLTAIAKAEKELMDADTPLEQKAIAFCWLAHLTGDIHQPLHCTSLFSQDFPKGDGGGNGFLIGKTNLHSFWDEVLGGDHAAFEHFDAVANCIYRTPQLKRDKLRELIANRSYQSWADESHGIAVATVYKDGTSMLKGGRQSHDHDHGPLVIPDFPTNYKTQAKSVAERRVALAGYRLAEKINATFAK